jgi:RNA polymerase sigma-70 factor (sigma-E family)
MARAWEAEFTSFYVARAAATRRTAYLLCGNWHEAEDLTQAAFVKLYQSWRRVRAETPNGYLRRIVLNEFLTRRRRVRREDPLSEVPDRAGPPGGDVEDRLSLLAALRGLPAQQRAVVVLRYWEGLSITQTAALLGIGEGTVKSQASRGVGALRTAAAHLGPDHIVTDGS